MVCIFISDGGPEAEEYDNNYFSYDESNAETVAKINYIIENCDIFDPQIRAELTVICKESYNQHTPYNARKNHPGWVGHAVNYCKQLVYKYL